MNEPFPAVPASSDVCAVTAARTHMKLALSVEEAARAAGICTGSLYKQWANGGGPKRKKLGRRTVVLLSDLEIWLRGLADAA